MFRESENTQCTMYNVQCMYRENTNTGIHKMKNELVKGRCKTLLCS